MITQTFDLDVIPAAVPVTVHLKQYQSEGFLVFNLFSRHGSLNIGQVMVDCIIRGTKKDGNGYSKDGSITSVESDGNGCTVQFEIDEQMTAIAGMNPFEITLTDSTGQMITATFFLDVQRAALDGNTITSESVVEEIGEFLENHPEYYTAATDDLIIVDDDEPESERNKLWIKPVGEQEIQIPTYEEFQELSNRVDSLPIDEETIHDYIDSHPELVSDFVLSASSDGNGNVTLHLYGGD